MSAPYYADDAVTLLAGDCLDVLPTLPDASVDAVVCDPPYGLGFMGKDWDSPGGTGDFPMRRFDAINTVNTGASRQGGRQRSTVDFARRQARDARAYGAWCEQWAAGCLRVLKPGGHLLAFGGTRTYHRIACAVEDAGFEIRDSISWLYGSGFPKSLDVSKAIDRHLGADRDRQEPQHRARPSSSLHASGFGADGWAPQVKDATTAAAAAEGWGTALKPAHEPIVVGRKSLAGTVAANILAHGTGALNVDGCRVTLADGRGREQQQQGQYNPCNGSTPVIGGDNRDAIYGVDLGRWPTNVLLDESQAAELDAQVGIRPAGGKVTGRQDSRTGDTGIYGAYGAVENSPYGDTGGASRFFPTFHYEAKAGTNERPTADGVLHPTVKPLDLMRWLVRLVTPRGGVVLDPFLGSGTTAEACVIEGFRCIGIERETAYLPLIVARLSKPIATCLDFGVTG